MGSKHSKEKKGSKYSGTRTDANDEDDALRMIEEECMHEIVPGLLLGSQFAAGFREPLTGKERPIEAARSALRGRRVTHILSCIDKEEQFANDGITYLTIKMSDSESFDIVSCLKRTNEFLQAALSGGGVALVHCQMGQSRSAAVVLGYLMQTRQMSFDEAYSLTKGKRKYITDARFGPQLRRLKPPVQYYKLDHSWALSRSGTGLDGSMSRGVAHFMESCDGPVGERSHSFESTYGNRVVRQTSDGLVYLSWGVAMPVSKDCPTGWHHMQWVIALSATNPSPVGDAVRPWLENPSSAALPSKEQLLAAAHDIWRVHGDGRRSQTTRASQQSFEGSTEERPSAASESN